MAGVPLYAQFINLLAAILLLLAFAMLGALASADVKTVAGLSQVRWRLHTYAPKICRDGSCFRRIR